MNRKILPLGVLIFGFLTAAAITQAQTSLARNVSIFLAKDPTSGLFTLTINDADGIKEFSLIPPGKFPYGGGLNGCPKTFKSGNIVFADPGDFTPKMSTTITDCQDKIINLELPPLKDGVTKGTIVSPTPEAVPISEKTTESSPTKLTPKPTLLANIQFPVPELNNCQSEVECQTYCDNPSNGKVCLAFAKEHNLLPEDEIAHLEKLTDVKDGPGGCNSQKSCEFYCNDVAHIDECVSFAEQHNFLSGNDLQDAKKVQSFIKAGNKLPGDCNGRQSCEAYCNNSDHFDECLNFGEQSGFLDQQEIQQYRKFEDLRKSGETPGKCTTKESCEAYCGNAENIEECLTFGQKAGFVSAEDAAMAQKLLPLLKEGKTPGGCRSKQQCEAYCNDEAHTDECVNFGIQAGLVSKDDAEIIRKTGGKGPGGCHSREQCQQYCQDNPKECLDWAQQNGIQLPAGTPANFSGPGGCKSVEECTAYCQANPKACEGFAPPSGAVNFPGGAQQGGGESGSGFSTCIPNGAEASYVCGINGRDAKPRLETTYFNECHAKQIGAQILHSGVCIRNTGPDKPCSDIANPVCGTDGGNYISECYAKEHGAGTKHEGVCTKEDYQQQQPPQNYPTSPEEYCKQYPDKCGSQYNQNTPQYQQPPQQNYPTPPEEYCKQYPDKCGGQYNPSPTQYQQQPSQNYPTSPEGYCKQYPDKCAGQYPH